MKNKIYSYIGFLLLLLLILAGPIFLISYYNDFQKLEATLRIREKQIEEERKYSLLVNDAYEKFLEYQTELKKIETAFPNKDLIIPEFHNFIKREVTYSGVILQSVGAGVTSPVGTNPNLEKTSFPVTLSGSYSVLKNFLVTLYNNARLVSVDSVSIRSTGGEGIFQINLILGVYSYK